jgi:amino acid transporter
MNRTRSLTRRRKKALGVPELVAVALGGMVGGGIFTILGISVAMIGVYTPIAILLGGLIAALAAYSYVKLGVYYLDEGATYSFIKRTYPARPFAASLLGWWVIFGYISTIALYAYTFSSYAISGTDYAGDTWVRKGVAGVIIATFTLINIWSVKGMGKVEDLMVYSKLAILAVIAAVLISNSEAQLPVLFEASADASFLGVIIVASVTFVAYEGFQLVINAVNETDEPKRNIPMAIYLAIAAAIAIYVIIAIGAILAIPFDDIIAKQEYALAAGAGDVLGPVGAWLVIAGALLATSSAISGTMFGASRQMAVIAEDGYFPKFLAHRNEHIPVNAIIAMSAMAFGLVAVGSLQVILEFGSITFLLVSLLMAIANHKIRRKTRSSDVLTLSAIIGLSLGAMMILYYEATTRVEQLGFIAGLYAMLSIAAWLYAKYGGDRKPA